MITKKNKVIIAMNLLNNNTCNNCEYLSSNLCLKKKKIIDESSNETCTIWLLRSKETQRRIDDNKMFIETMKKIRDLLKECIDSKE